MFKEITIGGIKVPMLANGATALRYKMVFHKDLLKEFKDAETEAYSALDSVPELAFIMAKAAEAKEGKADLNLLNQEMYLEWLERFGPMDLPLATEEIVSLYTANNEPSSQPKKNGKEKQSGN